MAGEALQHRSHAQLALPGHDPPLQLLVAVDPVLAQRPAPSVEATHPAERQERRPGKELRHLGIAEPVAAPHRLPSGLLPGHRQRHVDSVQGHPVDHPLPARPVPEGHGVAERAVVEPVAIAVRGGHADFPRHRRQGIGHIHLAAAPGELAMADILQVPVEPRADRHTVVAAEHDAAVPALDLEDVPPVGGGDDFDLEAGFPPGQHTLDDSACGGGGIAPLGQRGSDAGHQYQPQTANRHCRLLLQELSVCRRSSRASHPSGRAPRASRRR